MTCAASGSYSASCEVRTTTDGSDPEVLTQSASGSYSDCSQGFNDFEITGDFFYFNLAWGNEADCPAVWRSDGGYPLDVVSATVMSMSLSESCGPKAQEGCNRGGSRQSSNNRSESITLSEEWTPESTGDLISRVMGDLGSWMSGECTASRHLSEDESAFSITEGRVRVMHPRSSTGRLRVTIQVETTPDEGSPTVDTVTYNWTGSPDGPDIVGEWIDLPTPSDNATVEAAIIEVECNP